MGGLEIRAISKRIQHLWANLPLAKKGFIVVGLPIATIILTVLATSFLLNQLRQVESQINRAYETQLELQRVQNLVLDASSSVRGFLLTNRPDLLELYTFASEALPEQLDGLANTLARYPNQLEEFVNARTQIEQELSALETLLDLAPSLRETSPESINGFIITSQVVMEALEQQLIHLRDQQQGLVSRLEDSRGTTLTSYYAAIIFSLLISVLSLLVGVQLFASGITRRVKLLSVGAEQLAKGLSVSFKENSDDELGILSTTLVQTSHLLQEREEALQLASSAVKQKFDELTQRHHQIILLNQLGTALQNAETIDAIYEPIATKVQALCKQSQAQSMPSGNLYLYDDMLNAFVNKHSWGSDASKKDIIYAQQCKAFALGKYYLYNAEPSAYCNHMSDVAMQMTYCSLLQTSDKTLGLLVINGTEQLSDDQRQILGTMTDRISLTLHNLQLRHSLLQQAIKDPLTNLYNRRYLDETLKRELERAKRNEQPLSIIVADIDYFKQINDQFGHDAGDEVLKALGELLSTSFRIQDIACRYGGEEFVIVLPDTHSDDALKRAETLRENVKQIKLHLADSTLELFTISIGVSAFPHHGETAQLLIKHADTAMYRAKESGRDRVEMAYL